MKNVLRTIVGLTACIIAITSCGDKQKPGTGLKGHYTGKNLFVENPIAAEGVGFCIVEVKVNGRIATDETNSESFEVDLANMGLKEGDPVEVELIHKKGCEPVVKNPEVLQ